MLHTAKNNRSRLATRLIVSFIGIVLATTMSTGIPAYTLFRSELDKQAWSRVDDARRITETRLSAEKVRLSDLVILAAQRPTLQHMLQSGDLSGLPDYLGELKDGAGLDMLMIYSPAGELLNRSASSPDTPPLQLTSGSAFYWVDEPHQQLVMVVAQPIRETQSGEMLGYVSGGKYIDSAFVAQLAEETDYIQGIILNGERAATSLKDVEINQGELDTSLQVIDTARGATHEFVVENTRYYANMFPLYNVQGEPIAVMEVALPVTNLIEANQRGSLILLISTGLVIVFGSLLGWVIARRITAPIQQLVDAAAQISQGNLTSPIPIPPQPVEVTTLASTLEESRASILRTLDELSRSKSRLESLIQSIVEGVVTFDTQGNITFFSVGAENIMGCSQEEVLGKPLNAIFRLSDSEVGEFMEHIPPRGGRRRIDIKIREGRTALLAVTGARLAPPGSDAVQVALVFRDVTEDEATQRMRSYFLANITHEFRTPLAALSASVDLLLDRIDLTTQPDLEELIDSLRLSLLNLKTLINNLLESSSIEAGRFSIYRRPIILNHIVAESISVMQPLLTGRKQLLSLVEPTYIPPIDADPARLSQVIVNLLSNASKYAPVGRSIDVSIECRENDLRISIADRGPGIPVEERKNLFRRFMRLDTPGEVQYGIGLGLSVAKAIVEGHGGEIGVDGRPGGGSIFWFTIPVSKG
jgi:PAS domain S-box-containing protein